MITRIYGKNVEVIHKIDAKKKMLDNGDVVFYGKPQMITELNVTKGAEICNFNGDMNYNRQLSVYFGTPRSYDEFNISETETVRVEDFIFRADLNETHILSSKVLSETHSGATEDELNAMIKEFNAAMIESNDKMKKYCKIHKLDPEETDCIELFNIVYPDKVYKIVDGVIKEQFNTEPIYARCDANTSLFSTITNSGIGGVAF